MKTAKAAHAAADKPKTLKRVTRSATPARGSRYANVPVVLPLVGVRRAMSRTQAQVAAASGMTQPHVSELEAREDLDSITVGTLRRYLRALGVELEILATANDRRIVICAPKDGPEKG